MYTNKHNQQYDYYGVGCVGHISPYGGPGENRTPVHSAFNLKELQQFFTEYPDRNSLLILLGCITRQLRKPTYQDISCQL